MTKLNSQSPYSYLQDNTVPPFPDNKPLFVFDGICVLCSGTVGWFVRYDKRDLFRFATAQSPLGQALYRHYGLDMNETYLLIDRGVAYGKSDGYLHMADLLDGWWKFLRIFYLIPRPIRDWCYDIVARNRYRWFGTTGYCELIDDSTKAKMIK